MLLSECWDCKWRSGPWRPGHQAEVASRVQLLQLLTMYAGDTVCCGQVSLCAPLIAPIVQPGSKDL